MDETTETGIEVNYKQILKDLRKAKREAQILYLQCKVSNYLLKQWNRLKRWNWRGLSVSIGYILIVGIVMWIFNKSLWFPAILGVCGIIGMLIGFNIDSWFEEEDE